MSTPIASRNPAPVASACGAHLARLSTHGLDRPRPFARESIFAMIDRIEARRPPLQTAARQLNDACRQRQEALVQAGSDRPEFVGSLNSDMIGGRRCGASLETFVYRDAASGDTALIDVIRPTARAGGLPPLEQASCLLVKADGRVFKDGREVRQDSSNSLHASTRMGQANRAIAQDKLLRNPRDVTAGIVPPWASKP